MTPARIGELAVTFVHPDGARTPGCIRIDRPEAIDRQEARCAVGLDGLTAELEPVTGNDTFQALLLGLRSLATLLGDFQKKGGLVLHPDSDEPLDLGPYFGPLLRSPAAFTEKELEWRRPDAFSLIQTQGLVTTTHPDADALRTWFRERGYAFFSVDCSKGERDVRRQLGECFRWMDQFGYALDEDGKGNLNAVRDGFDFEVPLPGGLVLELLQPEVAWRDNPAWFEGLLDIAVEHSRYHLALGRRFLTLLVMDAGSPLVGRKVGEHSVPSPTRT